MSADFVADKKVFTKVLCMHQCGNAMSDLAAAGLDPGLPVLATIAGALVAELLHPSPTQTQNINKETVQFSRKDMQDLRMFDLHVNIDDVSGVFTLSLEVCPIVMQQLQQFQQPSGEPEKGN